jgi:hypothetical protein
MMKHPGEIRNVHIVNSVVSGAKSPNRSGIREFWPEFRRNLQPWYRSDIFGWSDVAASTSMHTQVRTFILQSIVSFDGRYEEFFMCFELGVGKSRK